MNIFSDIYGNEFIPTTKGWVMVTDRGIRASVTDKFVIDAMSKHGEVVTVQQQGYWTLDGVQIDDPENELGEEYSQVCEYVTEVPFSSEFIRRWTDSEIISSMAAKMAEVIAAEEAVYAEFLAKLDCAKIVFRKMSSMAFGESLSVAWILDIGYGKNIEIHSECNINRKSKIQELTETVRGASILRRIYQADINSLVPRV